MIGHWIAFGLFFLLIPIGFAYWGMLCTKKHNPTEPQKKNLHFWIGKATLLFWLYDLLYMAIFNQWLVWIYIFGILAVIIIFTNLIDVFLSENKAFSKLLPFDLLVGVGLSVYLIYVIPDEKLRNIVIAIVAALYGGILTLVGVSLTIRHSDKERKYEEKQKAKPIFTYNMLTEELKDIRTKKVCFDTNDDNVEYKCHVVAEIENSEHSVFEIKGIYHDNNWFDVEGNTVVLPNRTVYLDFRFNEDVNNLFLQVQDGLDNAYYYEIKVLALDFLNRTKQNQSTEFLHTVRGLSGISLDEINKRIAEVGKLNKQGEENGIR